MQLSQHTPVIVTGGASGLGRATAEGFAAAGAPVAIFDINEEAGQEVASAIGGSFHKVNILDEDSVVAGFAAARAAQGQERICVHCAMASTRGKTLAYDKQAGGYKKLDTDTYAQGVAGVLVASFRVASHAALGMSALDPMEDGERGCITMTASVAAQDAQIGQVVYGSAKAGVNGLVLPMARDLMNVGIRVNSIMPGIFATPLMLGAPQPVLDSLAASVPFPKRLGKPEEFASLAMELARNGYFNGQCLRLDGAIRMAPR
ncbi:MAG: SDR family oxidoreductase [Pseudomonadota bacterium]